MSDSFHWLASTSEQHQNRRRTESDFDPKRQQTSAIPLPDGDSYETVNTPSLRIQLREPGLSRSSQCSHYRPWNERDSIITAPSSSTGNKVSSSSNRLIQQHRSNNSETTTLMVPVSRYHIVLYKDSRMVVYDLDNRRVEARALSKNEENTIRAHRMSHCPMCGQVIDPCRFSFQAQSYFKILQDFLRTRFSTPSVASPHAETANPQRRQRGLGSCVAYESVLSEPFDGHVGNPFVLEAATTESQPDNAVADTDEEIPIPKNLSKEMFVTGYYTKFFREIRRLGTGSYGQVFLCHHILDDVYLGEYAVKKLPVGDNRQWLNKMLREIKIRERLHNANVVEYKHSWLEMHRTTPHLPIIPWLFLLMEFCNGGDLETFLVENRFMMPMSRIVSTNRDIKLSDAELNTIPMKESHIWKLFFDIANGLNHLHHSGILHRDLKPQNILLQCNLDTLTNQPATSALLADFGTSELLTERARHVSRQGFTGTIEFTAPELLEINECGELRDDYDEKSDIWSLGVVLYVLAFGKVPYNDDEPRGCRLKILGHSDPRLIIPSTPERSTDLVLLIEALLQRNPDARPSLDAVLCHRRIFKRLTDSEGLTDAGREISYLLPLFRSQNVSDSHPAQQSNRHGSVEHSLLHLVSEPMNWQRIES